MELPSYYIKRQVHGTFWFETQTMQSMLHLMPDNVMFETAYPPPTSLYPGPASVAETPRIVLDKALRCLPDALCRKVFFSHSSPLYHLDLSGWALPPFYSH